MVFRGMTLVEELRFLGGTPHRDAQVLAGFFNREPTARNSALWEGSYAETLDPAQEKIESLTWREKLLGPDIDEEYDAQVSANIRSLEEVGVVHNTSPAEFTTRNLQGHTRTNVGSMAIVGIFFTPIPALFGLVGGAVAASYAPESGGYISEVVRTQGPLIGAGIGGIGTYLGTLGLGIWSVNSTFRARVNYVTEGARKADDFVRSSFMNALTGVIREGYSPSEETAMTPIR